MDLGALAAVLSHLQQFEALFEDEGTDTITAPDGERICLHDVRKLYDQRYLLPRDDAVILEVSLYHSANGYLPDDPHIISILRQLCILTGTDYQDPAPQFLGRGGSMTFLGSVT